MKRPPSQEELWQSILHDPALLLHRIERRSGYDGETPPPLEDIEARFVPMSRRNYQASSHLDRRLVPSGRSSHRLSLRELLDRSDEIEGSARRVVYLFHTAFCGSTLLASCLDHPGACLSYKEPLSLSQVCLAKPCAKRPPAMTEDEWSQLTRSTVALLSKVFHPSEVALVKPANPCIGAIPELLLAARDRPRAILLYSNLTDFLCSILKSEGRRRWARQALAWSWPATPSHRILAKIDIESLPDEAAAAYVWLWQMYAYLDACESPDGGAVRMLDCDVFLSRPEETLTAAVEFLALPLPAEEIPEITSSETFRTYSKPALGDTWLGALTRRLGFSRRKEESFDAQRRRSLLRETAERHQEEIERGLGWAETVTRERPVPATLPNPL